MNAANCLTLARLLMTAPIVLLIYTPGTTAPWAAFYLFVLAMLTDVLDGALARRDPAGSPLGNYLDPAADKALLSAMFICLAQQEILPVWMAVVLVGREFLVDGVRAAGALQGKLVGSNWMGKTKTFIETLAVSSALLFRAVGPPYDCEEWPACDRGGLAKVLLCATWHLALAATVLAALFAVIFLWRNRSLFRSAKA